MIEASVVDTIHTKFTEQPSRICHNEVIFPQQTKSVIKLKPKKLQKPLKKQPQAHQQPPSQLPVSHKKEILGKEKMIPQNHSKLNKNNEKSSETQLGPQSFQGMSNQQQLLVQASKISIGKIEMCRRHSYQTLPSSTKHSPTNAFQINKNKNLRMNSSWNDMFQKLAQDLSQISGQKNENNSSKSGISKHFSGTKKQACKDGSTSSHDIKKFRGKSPKKSPPNKATIDSATKKDINRNTTKKIDNFLVDSDNASSTKNAFDSLVNENMNCIEDSILFSTNPKSEKLLVISSYRRASVNLVKINSEDFFYLTDEEEDVYRDENVFQKVYGKDNFAVSNKKYIPLNNEFFNQRSIDLEKKENKCSYQCDSEISKNDVSELENGKKNIKARSEDYNQTGNIKAITPVNNINLDSSIKINTFNELNVGSELKNRSTSKKDFLLSFDCQNLVKLKVRHEETSSSLNKNLTLLLNRTNLNNAQNIKKVTKISKNMQKKTEMTSKFSLSTKDSSFLNSICSCSAERDCEHNHKYLLSPLLPEFSSFVSSSSLETENKLSFDLMDINPYVIGVSFNRQSRILSVFTTESSITCNNSLNLLKNSDESSKNLKKDILTKNYFSEFLPSLILTDNQKLKTGNMHKINSVSNFIKCPPSLTDTKKLHEKKLEVFQGALVCFIEDSVLYVRGVPTKETNKQTYINDTTHIPILIDDLNRSQVYVTLFLPVAYREHVALKRTDELLQIVAFPARGNTDLRIRNLSGDTYINTSFFNKQYLRPQEKITYDNSTSKPQSSSHELFKVSLYMPSHTIGRSVEAFITTWGQLIVMAKSCATERRMTCNF